MLRRPVRGSAARNLPPFAALRKGGQGGWGERHSRIPAKKSHSEKRYRHRDPDHGVNSAPSPTSPCSQCLRGEFSLPPTCPSHQVHIKPPNELPQILLRFPDDAPGRPAVPFAGPHDQLDLPGSDGPRPFDKTF